jgi:hypothetical protein
LFWLSSGLLFFSPFSKEKGKGAEWAKLFRIVTIIFSFSFLRIGLSRKVR